MRMVKIALVGSFTQVRGLHYHIPASILFYQHAAHGEIKLHGLGKQDRALAPVMADQLGVVILPTWNTGEFSMNTSGCSPGKYRQVALPHIGAGLIVGAAGPDAAVFTDDIGKGRAISRAALKMVVCGGDHVGCIAAKALPCAPMRDIST